MTGPLSIGLDFGTNSVRALVIDALNGEELGVGVYDYPHGEEGILLDRRNPDLARQHPGDYLAGAAASVRDAIKDAVNRAGIDPAAVVGIGVATTGSTPIPVDSDGHPLAFQERFKDDLSAMAWLWKDHTAHAEAEEITEAARRLRPQYLAKCGGRYSSEWFWSKILHCSRVSPEVFEAADSWVECADWIPAALCGTEHPRVIKRGICAAGHKALYHSDWGGYPDEEFLKELSPGMARVRRGLSSAANTIAGSAGTLTSAWAQKMGLPEGIPVAVGAIDAHLGAVGSGIQPGILVKNIGTSTCDMMVAPLEQALPDIPGLCGIVPESILPGCDGLEAGQSAVGDIFNWFVRSIQPAGMDHAQLTAEAEKLSPGASGLLALDWHSGNRTILVDQRLSGMLIGLSLHTTPAEIFRALVEATAFGARVIIERLEEYGVKVGKIINCGGISAKNALAMQIYADVANRPLMISRSNQTAALGAAIAGAVVGGAQPDYATATRTMTGVQERVFQPIAQNAAVYERLFRLYRRLHDGFGIKDCSAPYFDVMKELLSIRDEARSQD